MKARSLLPRLALALGLWSAPADAGQGVVADSVVYLAKSKPAHQLAEVARIQVPYGPNTLGFEPPGPERLATAPAAFDVDMQGNLIVADPVRGKLVRVDVSSSTPSVAPIAELPLPFSDLAVDRDGAMYVTDLKSRTVRAIGGAAMPLTARGHAMKFVRHGDRLVVRSGATAKLVDGGTLVSRQAVTVEKCNAEAGLITVGGKKIKVEIGGPLASVRLIGIDAGGDIFLLFEQFRTRGRLDVDRRVVVVDAAGSLRATLDVTDTPTFHPLREFVLGPRGALHQMVPTNQGVTFVRWEVK